MPFHNRTLIRKYAIAQLGRVCYEPFIRAKLSLFITRGCEVPMRFLFAVLALLSLVDPSSAQMKVRVNWSAIAAGQSGIWIAHEEGLFKKNGLDVELLHIPSSSLIIQTILAGEVAISYVDGRNTIQSNLTGSDVVLIAGVTNRFPFTFMARPEFKRVNDLRGKRIGVTRIGSSTHTVTLYVLNQAGLKPGDYEIVPMGEVPNILIALAAGRIDAGPLSSPTTIRAAKPDWSISRPRRKTVRNMSPSPSAPPAPTSAPTQKSSAASCAPTPKPCIFSNPTNRSR